MKQRKALGTRMYNKWSEEESVQLANGIQKHGLVYKKLFECIPTRSHNMIREKIRGDVLNMKT